MINLSSGENMVTVAEVQKRFKESEACQEKYHKSLQFINDCINEINSVEQRVIFLSVLRTAIDKELLKDIYFPVKK